MAGPWTFVPFAVVLAFAQGFVWIYLPETYQRTTDEIKNEVKEIAKVSAQLNDKVEQTNRNVELAREETKLLRDDIAEIKSMIQQ